jgi:hypothetical protein
MADTTQTPDAKASEPTQPTPPAPTEKMVPESDVVKAKGGLQKQLEEAKSQLNEAHNLKLQAEARAQTLEENLKTSAEQLKELEHAKAVAEESKKTATEASNTALKYRKELMAKEYGVPTDTIKDYGMSELDMFEKALKVVKSAAPTGQYAAGGGSGAAQVPTSAVDRALKNLQKAQPGTPNKS